jgi:hypothetical protein
VSSLVRTVSTLYAAPYPVGVFSLMAITSFMRAAHDPGRIMFKPHGMDEVSADYDGTNQAVNIPFGSVVISTSSHNPAHAS